LRGERISPEDRHRKGIAVCSDDGSKFSSFFKGRGGFSAGRDYLSASSKLGMWERGISPPQGVVGGSKGGKSKILALGKMMDCALEKRKR